MCCPCVFILFFLVVQQYIKVIMIMKNYFSSQVGHVLRAGNGSVEVERVSFGPFGTLRLRPGCRPWATPWEEPVISGVWGVVTRPCTPLSLARVLLLLEDQNAVHGKLLSRKVSG